MTAEEFRAFLKAQNWTQQKAAEMLGATQPTISEWVTGKHAVPRFVVAHIRTIERRKLPVPGKRPKEEPDNG